jgi:amino acid adenylation domain-containing protein
MSQRFINDRAKEKLLSPEALALIEQRENGIAQGAARIRRDPHRRSAPLSFAQQTVWLLTQLDQSTAAYNRSLAMRLVGRANHRALQRALSEIVRRHEVLRSRIAMSDAIPAQHVFAVDTIPLPVIDLSELPEDTRNARVRELLDAEARRPFDLADDPLLRAGILRVGDSDQTLFISTHHIASDGWSDGVLIEELRALYGAFAAGNPSPLPELRMQYGDFAVWEREREGDEASSRNARYWTERLRGAPVELELPADRARRELPSMDGGRVTLSLSPELVEALESIGRQEGATLAMTLLSAFHLLLARLTGQSDIIVGLPIAGRTRADVEGLIGLFSAVLPVRVSVDLDVTFRDLLARVRIAMLEAHDHQDVSDDVLLDALTLPDGSRAAQIAQALFNFRNMPAAPLSLSGLEVHAVDMFNGSCVTDLDLEVRLRGNSRECELRYSTELYEASTASRLLGHFAVLLESIAQSPEETVGRLPFLTNEERRTILVEWNGATRELPTRLYLHELIEAQARATPDAIAVTSEDGKLTYRELDSRANALARVLVLRGVRPGSRVGVCMERSSELMISLIAVWKAGAAFIPLDTDHPSERLAVMLADSTPALVLADQNGASALGSCEVEMLRINAGYIRGLKREDAPLLVAHEPNAIACVLYTSGSTGVPKGVQSTHRGIANNLLDMKSRFALTKDDCTLQQTSLGFDGAAWELFWPLMIGARVHLPRPGGQRDPAYLVKVIAERKIAMFSATPSMLQVMLDQPGFTQCGHIRIILAIGEVLSPALQTRILTSMPNAELTNVYGPSETSITVTAWKCERGNGRRSVPIGRPQTNIELYILDSLLQPVPIGVAGEIYIGGVAVSLGYLNRPELTAERFIRHPFRPESRECVYRSGDIARFGADGVIEYIGRSDHQLKIRGVRVELGEIEAALDRLPAVRESVVVARDDAAGEKRMIAYVVLDDQTVTPLQLRRALERHLPSQFIPAAIIPIDIMPHGTNGKVDRAALPDALGGAAPARIISPPQYQLDRRLARIWQEMLEVPDIGIHDSFFDLGGHSLLAVRMLRRVADELGDSIGLRDLYAEPTIDAMARSILGTAAPGRIGAAPPLLKLRDGNARPPLFYLNGQPPGNGLYVLELPRYLNAEQPIYIVRTPFFQGPVSVEGVAAKLLERIRAETPHGPYVLAGNCFGAWLALEIGRQLVTAGEHVPLIAILHPVENLQIHLGFRLMRRLALFAGVPEDYHLAEFSSVGDYVKRTTVRMLEELRRASPRERIDGIGKAGRWIWSYLGRYASSRLAGTATRTSATRPTDQCAAQDSHHLSAEEQIEAHRGEWWDAWMRYRPQPYPGRIAMLWPREEPGNPPWNPRADWAHLTSDLDWRVVSGDHTSMMHEYLEETAFALDELIEEVRQH